MKPNFFFFGLAIELNDVKIFKVLTKRRRISTAKQMLYN